MNLDQNALMKSAGIGAAGLTVLSLFSLIPLVGLVCCCVVILGYAAVGAAYGYFAQQNATTPINAGSVAIGGGLAALIAGAIQSLISGLVSMVFVSASATAATLEQLEAAGVPPDVAAMAAGGAAGIGGVLISLCIGSIIAAVLGAIGGAIYGATQGNRPMASPPAV